MKLISVNICRQKYFILFLLYILAVSNYSVLALAPDPEPIHIEGFTMGTTYHVTYYDRLQRNFKVSVDSLLDKINKSISTYDPVSEVSTFNRSQKEIRSKSLHFHQCLKKALAIAKASSGAFDPTVMPLVNAWGFGPGKNFQPDARIIDSLISFVGYKKITLTDDRAEKSDPRVQLDFGGIGQGYGADEIAFLLKSKGINDFLVELGGEGLAFGKNLVKNEYWTIGILDPNSTRDDQFFKAYVKIKDRAFTTSGNYFNYREIDGRKYGHTINPQSGYPVENELLAVSVFATDCATADAWATALMVMGKEKATALLESHPELDALLIFSTERKVETFFTRGIASAIYLE